MKMSSRLGWLFCSLWLLPSAVFSLTPSEALDRLIEGHKRFLQHKLLHTDRHSLLEGQKPFATILSCSDSRVIPEIIFDQKEGDLFIVRVAGNVASAVELESIGFATQALGSSLIVVIGHQSCGAVNAVLAKQTAEIPHIASLIEPAVKKESNLEQAIKANVRHVVATLKQAPLLKQRIAEQKVSCIGAYYDLANGRVEFLK
jgi:carbonic anhydrase